MRLMRPLLAGLLFPLVYGALLPQWSEGGPASFLAPAAAWAQTGQSTVGQDLDRRLEALQLEIDLLRSAGTGLQGQIDALSQELDEQGARITVLEAGADPDPEPEPEPGAHAIPGVIEAEAYRAGGEGVGFHDTTLQDLGGDNPEGDPVDIKALPDPDGQGGLTVGWTTVSEWLAYDVAIEKAGSYRVTVRVANGTTAARSLRLELDGPEGFRDLAGAISVPPTGGWSQQVDISAPVELPKGEAVLRVVFVDTPVDLNRMTFAPGAAPDPGPDPGPPGEPPQGAILVQPGDDIQAAFAGARAGDVIVVRGHHRIATDLPVKDNQVIWLDREDSIIDGSVLLDPNGWTLSGGLWSQAIPNAEGCPNASPTNCRRDVRAVDNNGTGPNPLAGEPEKLIVDDRIILEVSGTPSGMQWRHRNGRAELGFNPAGRVIEVTHAKFVFNTPASNVQVKGPGLIRGAASWPDFGMIHPRQGDWGRSPAIGWAFTDGLRVENSASMGLRVSCAYVDDVTIAKNGQMGSNGYGPSEGCQLPTVAPADLRADYTAVLSNSRITDNNVAKFANNWNAGGIKWGLGMRDFLMVNNDVWENEGSGLWTDNIGTGGAEVRNNRLWHNTGIALHAEFLEKTEKHPDYAVLFEDNILVDNGRPGADAGFQCNGGQITVRRQPDMVARRNLIVTTGSRGGGVLCIKAGAGPGDAWFPKGALVEDNTIVILHPDDARWGLMDNNESGVTLQSFMPTTFRQNTFVLSPQDSTDHFWLVDSLVGETEWKAAGFDTDSTFLRTDPLAWLRENAPEAHRLLH